MRWESIIGFIFIALISSFFNKDKNKTTTRSPEDEARPHGDLTASQTKPTSQQSRTIKRQEPKNRRTTAGLDEMLRELNHDINDVFNQKKSKKPKPVESYPANKEDVAKIKQESPDVVRRKVSSYQEKNQSPIYKDEKKKTPSICGLDMDRKAVIQGIIMSEVLGKPKSMRNR